MKHRANADANRGQVGIGTLIVFIAMVLVAAIAAGVLIHTAGFLQTQAEDTGEGSADQVTDQLNVITETGEVQNNDEIHELRVGVQPAAGSGDINLAELTVQYLGGGEQGDIIVGDENGDQADGDAHPDDVESGVENSPGDFRFGIEVTTAENDDDIVMTDNSDRYVLIFNTSGAEGEDDAGQNLGPLQEGDSVQLTITTEVGSQTTAILQVPASLRGHDDGDIVTL